MTDLAARPDLTTIAARHFELKPPAALGPEARYSMPRCDACLQSWPCDAAALLSELRGDDLGAAWREAEAALPEGWALNVGTNAERGRVEAWAGPPNGLGGIEETRPTPAAALRALAAALTEGSR